MDFRDYIRMLSRTWALIVGLAVIGAAAGGGYAALQRPVYESTAKAFVSTQSGQSLADLSAGAGYLQVALKGYADIATTSYVLTPVIRGLKLDTTPALLAEQVSVTAATDSAILEVTVSDSSPQRAKQIADAITAQLSQAVVDLTPVGATASRSVVKLTRVDPALVPTSPAGIKPALAILIGALAGIVLAVLIGLLREVLDTRVRGKEDLERVTEAPLLGTTARNARGSDGLLVLRDAESSTQAEDYRTIRTNLRFVQLDAANRSIVVTSSDEREGKSTTAANLALAVAHLGQRVLLIDADLRRPTLATLFGVDGSIGLSDVVIGDATPEQGVQRVDAGRLDLLAAGAVPPNPNELLQSASMDALLADLRTRYDLIVIDSPPLIAVSDATVLAAKAGGAIIVAAAGRSRRGRIRQALESLERADARILGVVLTMVPGKAATAYGYGLQSVPDAKRRTVQPSAPRDAERRAVVLPAVKAPVAPFAEPSKADAVDDGPTKDEWEAAVSADRDWHDSRTRTDARDDVEQGRGA